MPKPKPKKKLSVSQNPTASTVNYTPKPAGTKKPVISNTQQEGLDILQKLSKVGGKGVLRKIPFGIGASVGLTQSAINGEKSNFSDILGLIPTGVGQAASLSMMYAEKEKENLAQFAANKMRGKDLTKLKPKDKELNLAVKSTIADNKPLPIKKKTKNTTPVTSKTSTKVLRSVLGALMPDQAAQFLSAIATKDNKLGVDDLTPDIKEALINSVKNAQKRTGKTSGGTQYADFGPEAEKAFQGMKAGAGKMLSTDPSIQAASMVGRVSYKKNAKGEIEIYDSYDFSKTNPDKADSLYKKIRAYAGEALPDKGNQPNLIGKIPATEQLAFGTGQEGIELPDMFNQMIQTDFQEVPTQETPVQKAARLKAERQAARALLDKKTAIRREGIVAQKRADFLKTMAAANFTDEAAYIKYLNDNNSKEDVLLDGQYTQKEAGKNYQKESSGKKCGIAKAAAKAESNTKYGYGTNSQGIMKTKMNPRKRYANGSDSKGVDPSHYIVSPAEAVNDYNIMLAKAEAKANSNPWLPVVAIVGGLAQQAIGMGKAKSGGGDTGGGGDIDASTDLDGVVAANGMNNVQKDVEVEGGEVYETPQGQVGKFKGPSHDQGGIPLEVVDTPVANPNQGDVQKETKVYSVDLMLQGKSLAERKEARERQTANLEKIASEPLVDQAIKNSAKRKMMAVQKEEAGDLAFQEKVNNMQQLADTMVAAFGTGMAGLQDNPIGDSMRYASGTGVKGVMKYANGSKLNGIDPPWNYIQGDANLNGIVDTEENPANRLSNANKALEDYLNSDTHKKAGSVLDNILTKTDADTKSMMAGSLPSMVSVPTPSPIVNTGKTGAPGFVDGFGMNVDQTEETTSNGISFTKPPMATDEEIFTGFGDSTPISQEDIIAENNKIIEASPEESSNLNVAKALKTDKPGSAMSRFMDKAGNAVDKMGGMPSIGDMTKLFGNYLGMTAGIKTANEQRSTDVTHRNVYANAGKESQKLLDNAKQGIEISKAQAVVKATDISRGGKRGGRNSARGVNQMRAMDWLYDTALQSQIADISAKAAEQVSGIDIQKSSVAMNADQLKGQGEYQAAMANEAAKDAYYTALGQGRKDFATGLQQTGKDLNAMKENKIIENIMKKYGNNVQMDLQGNMTGKMSKKTKSTDEEIFTGPGGKKYKRGKDGNLIEVTV